MHILLQLANRYRRPSAPPAPVGCVYDPVVGAWRSGSLTGQLLVELANRPPLQTKKQDVETGEDQKGA